MNTFIFRYFLLQYSVSPCQCSKAFFVFKFSFLSVFVFFEIYTSCPFDREYTMFIEWRTKIKLSLQIIGFNGLNLLSSLLLCDCYNESIMLFCKGATMCSVLTVDDVYRMTCFYYKLEIILELRGAL